MEKTRKSRKLNLGNVRKDLEVNEMTKIQGSKRKLRKLKEGYGNLRKNTEIMEI